MRLLLAVTNFTDAGSSVNPVSSKASPRNFLVVEKLRGKVCEREGNGGNADQN